MKTVGSTSVAKSKTATLKSSSSKQSRDRLSELDFLLASIPFVKRCAAVFLRKNAALSNPEIQQMADAIQAGRPRFEILDLISAKAKSPKKQVLSPPYNRSTPSNLPVISIDLLERFSPGNDEMFVVEVYQQAAGRLPSSLELVEGCIELKRDSLPRLQFIKNVSERFSSGGSLFKRNLPAKPAVETVAGAIVPNRGKRRAAISHDLLSLEWLQKVVPENPNLKVPEGWLLLGALPGLERGAWALDVDIDQPSNARLIIDVVAGSDVEKLIGLEIEGPCLGKFGFQVLGMNHLTEARVFKPKQKAALHALTVRKLSISEQV